MANPSEPLVDLVFKALDHAVKSVINSNGPLIPFAMMESAAGMVTLARFMSGRDPEEARQHARAHVAAAADCIRYAIAGDGHVTENGQRTTVVSVEAGEQGSEPGFMFIQRFASSRDCRFAEPVGNPGIIAQPPVLPAAVAG